MPPSPGGWCGGRRRRSWHCSSENPHKVVGLVVVVVCDRKGVVAGVGQHRCGQQLVAVDECLKGGDPVVVVFPLSAFGFRGALPVPDRRDQGFLEFAPGVMTEFGQRERKSESPALPFVIELRRRLVGGAGLVQPHDDCPASATPIIASVVTRSINISSVKSSVPAGLSGMTNHRE